MPSLPFKLRLSNRFDCFRHIKAFETKKRLMRRLGKDFTQKNLNIRLLKALRNISLITFNIIIYYAAFTPNG